jgi:endonuclease/exonuclease/phosphatase family metal-dependent hydrolase
VLTFNVNSCYAGVDNVAREILSPGADIVLVQELFSHGDELATILRRTYPVVEVSGQFLIATRYQLLTTLTPQRMLSVGETMRTARFVRYTLTTPMGDVAIYNMHPLSPRGALWMARKGGFRHQLLQGHIFDGEMERATQYHAAVRNEQAGAVAEMAKNDQGSVLIAGDTNLPGTSPVLRRTFGKYQDGFLRAGWGLGYTFPEILPWMRLDRILASESLKFVGCSVACRHVSDHYCVVADLQRRDP